MKEGLGKKYMLCSKTVMSSVYEKGEIVKSYPFLMRYLPVELKTEAPFQIVISVPKRRFKKAVDRNRIKRLIKEAVRKKKHILERSLEEREEQLAVFLIYTGQKEESYQKISNKIETVFLRLVKERT